MALTTRTVLTWIGIELVDADGKPVAGEAYEITLPDGSVRSGTTDDAGKAQERGIDPGLCQVAFPNLPSDAWSRG
jgi:type VI secretion system secreted protein VgrG